MCISYCGMSTYFSLPRVPHWRDFPTDFTSLMLQRYPYFNGLTNWGTIWAIQLKVTRLQHGLSEIRVWGRNYIFHRFIWDVTTHRALTVVAVTTWVGNYITQKLHKPLKTIVTRIYISSVTFVDIFHTYDMFKQTKLKICWGISAYPVLMHIDPNRSLNIIANGLTHNIMCLTLPPY